MLRPNQTDIIGGGPDRPRVIVIDDETAERQVCSRMLASAGVPCDQVPDGPRGLEAVRAGGHDLVLLDVDMPEMAGPEVLRRLRADPPRPHLKVVMMSGRATGEEMARMLSAGADDYLGKPFGVVELRERVKAALRLKDAQDRADLLNRQMLAANRSLERGLAARDSDLVQARGALALSMAELVGCRDAETGAHLTRIQHYCRALAGAAGRLPAFSGQIDADFVAMLECCAPLHDIGKVGVPDHILLKPGPLTEEERAVMQRHTVVGAATLEKVATRYDFAVAFWQTAVEVVRHHHERFDGTGYPDRLKGGSIPLAARIVTVADVYDALRSARPYKPALPHAEAVATMTGPMAGHFDPALLAVFESWCGGEFERIFAEMTD